MEFKHTSVLLKETIENLRVKPDGIYVDGTLGGGGHSFAIASVLSGNGRLIGIDRDEEALEAAADWLAPFKDRVRLVHGNYADAADALRGMGIDKVDGIVLDLGVSSYQLDNAGRGFSYKYDAPLDMRMDKGQALSAKEIVNTYTETELYRIIKDYGEERFAGNIARQICMARKDKPVETTGELNEIIKAAVPARMRAAGGHPSKRTFQAIRIECNAELESLETSLDGFIDMLKAEGRLCIITFHSLEDRIVKSAFRRNENPCVCPPDFPICVCGRTSKGKAVTSKPILPSAEEVQINRRAKSAKLRVFERK